MIARTACQCTNCGTLHVLPERKQFQQELIGVVCVCGNFVTPQAKKTGGNSDV